MEKIEIKPIAYIKNGFNEKFGIPRQPLRAPSVISKIVFLKEYSDISAFKRLSEFSHIWVLFEFSKSKTEKFTPTVRPPRLGGNEKVGVFASRSPFRPNNIGLSLVKLISVDKTLDGKIALTISGADMLNDTPIIDIKPYVKHSDCIVDAVSGYADNFENYSLEVVIKDSLKAKIKPEFLAPIIECLKDDPRPSYQEDGKIYGMAYENLNVKFIVENGVLTVIEIKEN